MTTEREDETELRKLAYRYARMIDSRDWDLIGQVFSEDACLSGPGYEMKGHRALRDGLKRIEMYSSTMHCVHNQSSQLGVNEGTGELYCVANHIYEKEGVAFKLDMGIRYEDRYSRGPDGWRIADRVLNLIWQQDLPLEMSAGLAAGT